MRSLAAVIGLLTGLGVLSAQFYQQDFNSGVPTDWSLNTNDLGSTTTGLYNEWIVGADYNNPPPTFTVPLCGIFVPPLRIFLLSPPACGDPGGP
jgi:hypothetical protein